MSLPVVNASALSARDAVAADESVWTRTSLKSCPNLGSTNERSDSERGCPLPLLVPRYDSVSAVTSGIGAVLPRVASAATVCAVCRLITAVEQFPVQASRAQLQLRVTLSATS